MVILGGPGDLPGRGPLSSSVVSRALESICSPVPSACPKKGTHCLPLSLPSPNPFPFLLGH